MTPDLTRTTLATITYLRGPHRHTRTGYVRQNCHRLEIKTTNNWRTLCYTDEILNIWKHR